MKAQAIAQTSLTHSYKQKPFTRLGKSSLVVAAHPKLLDLIRSSHGVPCFICAPGKTGRSSLALDYAQRSYHLDEVLWIEGASENFRHALSSNTLLEHLEFQIMEGLSSSKLVVIDDVPFLQENIASRFSDWVDQLVKRGVEVIIITTPQDDCLGEFQSDRLLIDGKRLVDSQHWQKPRLIEALNCFFAAPIPQDLVRLAALMLLMGQGIVDNLRELAYQIPAGSHVLLKKFCPFFEIDEETGYFNTSCVSAADFAAFLPGLLLEAPRTVEEQEASEAERCFERLTQLSLHLFERSERSQSQLLLEMIGNMLAYEESTETTGGFTSLQSNVKAIINKLSCDEAEYEPDSNLPSEMPELLVVRLFGDFEVFRGGHKIESPELHRKKVRELFIHLILNMGRGVSRDTLMERIWPGKDASHAKVNFYATWSRLCRTLSSNSQENPYISNNGGLCRLELRAVHTDVFEFEQLSKFVFFEKGSVEERIDAIYRLEQIYRGDLVSGCTVDPLLLAAKQRYRSTLVDVMIAASKLFSLEGNNSSAVWFARKAYDTDSTREDVYRILMTMQDKAGQRTSALRTYFDCKRFLSEELGILPSQKTTALYQDLILDRR
jgi:DNA-binding SARP family transcriptional activator